MLHTLHATEKMGVATPRRAPLRFFKSFSSLEWHAPRSLEVIGTPSVHKDLVPQMPRPPLLCLSSAPWFPFLECQSENRQARRQTCRKQLDKETFDSLQTVQTCRRGPSCHDPLQSRLHNISASAWAGV